MMARPLNNLVLILTGLLTIQLPALSFASPVYSSQNKTLPEVDLGYELQRATSFNSTGKYYTFSNIRYAAPPTGANRFNPPQLPGTNRTTVQTGSPDRICPQANPAWPLIAQQFIPEFLGGQTHFNASSFNTSTGGGGGGLPPQDPRTTEDCLFLDVEVPQKIFQSVNTTNATAGAKGAPVLVWIYGGGYTAGSKSDSGNPAGLIKRSERLGRKGVIYVSINYRLGAFGWLAGPTFQENGTANVGLLDQRLALEWVQKHISKFGGDPDRVTVFGESAGGGSIMHQITAWGGARGAVPFQQAVLQSPGFQPLVSDEQQETTFASFLGLLGVATLEEARSLPYEALQTANIVQVGGSSYGSFTYGPAVDGDMVPALPGQLLLHNQFAKDVKVMVGHNGDEGLLFTSPFIQNNSALRATLIEELPTMAAFPNIVKYITQTLYPPIFNGSQAAGYTNQIARAAAIISEVIFACNTFYLDTAYGNDTYGYYFTVPPAIHGQDVPYTYYNGPSASVIDPAVALALQEYITDFAISGTPNSNGVPFFSRYGANATVQELGLDGIRQVMDPAANARCSWWQKAQYA